MLIAVTYSAVAGGNKAGEKAANDLTWHFFLLGSCVGMCVSFVGTMWSWLGDVPDCIFAAKSGLNPIMIHPSPTWEVRNWPQIFTLLNAASYTRPAIVPAESRCKAYPNLRSSFFCEIWGPSTAWLKRSHKPRKGSKSLGHDEDRPNSLFVSDMGELEYSIIP